MNILYFGDPISLMKNLENLLNYTFIFSKHGINLEVIYEIDY